jgi:pantothenate synthetase
MKKFNGMESKLIIDALDCYVTQVEKDILELEKDGKTSIFAPGFYTMISKELKDKVRSMTKKQITN